MRFSKKVKTSLMIFNVLVATATISAVNVQQIKASSTEDYEKVIKEAPVGLDISKYFDVGKFKLSEGTDWTVYPFQTNSATIYNSTDASDAHNNRVLNLATGGKTVVSSTDSSDKINISQTGAAWSKIDDETDNYIDISKKQTVSVWLYFGAGDGEDSRENGEGMSLVLHNDPRGTSAMGAGYQGMGVMGFDNQLTGQTQSSILGVIGSWKADTGYKRSIASSEEAASTAVANSISLNFNSQNNDLMTNSSQFIQPIATGYGPASSGLTSNSRVLPYTVASFGTPYSQYPAPTTYPEYDNLMNGTDLGNYPLRLGNGGSAYGIISLTYPGSDLTYKNIPLNNLRGDNLLKPTSSNAPWNLINKKNNGYGMSTYQAAAKSANLTNGGTVSDPVYWHHVTYTWNPASNGNPATISYDFNDKLPDGSVNNGQIKNYKEVSTTIPVDPSVFGNPTDNKVYWGLTGANNGIGINYSKLAVFESIPALATATVDTQLSDVSLNPPKVIKDGDTDNVVGNGHNVEFNYKLTWDDMSRKDWTNIKADIDLPLDIDYSTATITYHNASGSSEPITIANASDMSGNELKYTIASLGNVATSDGYTSADITVSGKANNQTSVPITEEPEPAVFNGDNAIETSSTPTFVIDSNQLEENFLEMKVSNSLAFQDINYQTTKEYLQRKTAFELSVTNLKEPWNLKVSSDGLSNGSEVFKGDVVYKQSADSEPLVLNRVLQQIASGEGSETTTTTDLAGQWSNNTGLLLMPTSNKVMPAGKYTGTLTWELSNSNT